MSLALAFRHKNDMRHDAAVAFMSRAPPEVPRRVALALAALASSLELAACKTLGIPSTHREHHQLTTGRAPGGREP